MVITRDILELERRAAELRWRLVEMMGMGKAHHFGGSLSSADMIAALYFRQMRYDPADPCWPDRDRFVMSKGHSVPAQYAALAMLGVFSVEELATLKRLGSRLQGHPVMGLTPGIEACTGALGEGLSFANGLALAAKLTGREYRVYCMVGDGELHEGQLWEAFMTAARRRLDNLVVLVDRNRLKAMDGADTAKSLDRLDERLATFGWAVREINGHDMREICAGLDWATAQEGPAVLIAHTVKGRGVSFMEDRPGFHNAALSDGQWAQARAELARALAEKQEQAHAETR